MGGGASNSKQPPSQKEKPSQKEETKKTAAAQQGALPSHVVDRLRRCLSSLPFPPDAVTEQTIQLAAQKAQRVEVAEPKVILAKGEKAKGLYIIVQGEAEVVSSSGVVVATLAAGDFFGELSTLYQIPCTATVRTPTKVLMLHLTSAALAGSLAVRAARPTDMLDYMVRRRYLDTSGAVNQSELMQRIARAVLKEVPLFKSWGDEALQSLVESMEAEGPAITLAPSQSIIAMEGDQADEIIIMIKGRVEVRKQKELLAALDCSKWPVWLGEEGLFAGSERRVSVKTLTACQLVIIKNALINEAAKKFKTEAAADFSKRLDRWRKKLVSADPGNKSMLACYQLEVLLQRLSSTTLLAHSPIDVLYRLALSAKTQAWTAGSLVAGEGTSGQGQSWLVRPQEGPEASQASPAEMDPSLAPGTKLKAADSSRVFSAEDAFLLALKGAMILNDKEEWTTKDDEVLWLPKAAYPSSRLVAKGDCVVLALTGSALDEACSEFSDLLLTVPTTVR